MVRVCLTSGEELLRQNSATTLRAGQQRANLPARGWTYVAGHHEFTMDLAKKKLCFTIITHEVALDEASFTGFDEFIMKPVTISHHH